MTRPGLLPGVEPVPTPTSWQFATAKATDGVTAFAVIFVQTVIGTQEFYLNTDYARQVGASIIACAEEADEKTKIATPPPRSLLGPNGQPISFAFPASAATPASPSEQPERIEETVVDGEVAEIEDIDG